MERKIFFKKKEIIGTNFRLHMITGGGGDNLPSSRASHWTRTEPVYQLTPVSDDKGLIPIKQFRHRIGCPFILWLNGGLKLEGVKNPHGGGKRTVPDSVPPGDSDGPALPAWLPDLGKLT